MFIVVDFSRDTWLMEKYWHFDFSKPIYLRTVIFNIFILANVPVFIRVLGAHYCIKSDNVLIAFFFEQLFVMKKMILNGDAFFYCKYYTTRLSCLYRLFFDLRQIYIFLDYFCVTTHWPPIKIRYISPILL